MIQLGETKHTPFFVPLGLPPVTPATFFCSVLRDGDTVGNNLLGVQLKLILKMSSMTKQNSFELQNHHLSKQHRSSQPHLSLSLFGLSLHRPQQQSVSGVRPTWLQPANYSQLSLTVLQTAPGRWRNKNRRREAIDAQPLVALCLCCIP